MKLSDFAKVLRQIIREEVKAVVKEELQPIKKLLKEEKLSNIKKPTQPLPTQRPVRRSSPTVSFDGPLGNLLNETARSMMTSHDEWEDINNGPFNSGDAMNFGATSLMSAINDSVDEDLPSTNTFNDPTRMFVKDYSAVMKAADAHAGNKF